MAANKTTNRWLFAALVCFALVVQFFFFANIISWRSAPDVGWIRMSEFGPKKIGFASPLGEEAGLRKGDKILSINGTTYETADELYTLIDFRIGHVTVYDLERGGKRFTVSVTTRELGLKRVIIQSGLTWIVGMIFLAIGTLVFLMKPYDETSWAFLLMTLLTGIFISYMSGSFAYKPSWLHSVKILVTPFLPAAVLHLTVLFPQRRAHFADRKLYIAVPYLVSLTLAILSRSITSHFFYMPHWLLNIIYFYMLISLLLFLASTIYSYIVTSSVAIRLRSLGIFSGFTIAMFIPMIEMLSNLVFKVSFFPNPIIFYLFFLLFFPLSIGYTIVRHDLFEIDVIVRRTYGYILSTSTIVGAYALIVSGLNTTFLSAEISRSPLFSITFALGVVFLFGPLHKRFQRLVDRVFYRQQYDYRKTITNVSEAMTSILDPDLIHRTLVGSVVKEMFLENGLLLFPEPAACAYCVQVAEGVDAQNLVSRRLGEDEVLLRMLRENDKPIFRHDLDLHPRYENHREALQQTFQSFASELMIPMKYKDEIRGIISLGGKKSGKMFTLEDLDLLKTLTNQSVIALENARLFAENLEKGRMEEELKIAHDIQMSMLPDKAPKVEGFTIAARSIPAREVGGDFYDFMEMRGNGAGGRLGIVIGDVSGKSVSAALVMAASRSIFRVLSEAYASVEEVMAISNVRLNRDIKKGTFVALAYAVLDSKHKTLTLANAGQTQPILCPGDGSQPIYLDTAGDKFPLGIVRRSRYQETQVPLRPGDTLVFYSDGVVEAMNEKEELYGFERFMGSIEDGRTLGVDALLQKLLEDVTGYVGKAEPHDDLTIVVVQVE